jgi:hypothetical protein
VTATTIGRGDLEQVLAVVAHDRAAADLTGGRLLVEGALRRKRAGESADAHQTEILLHRDDGEPGAVGEHRR